VTDSLSWSLLCGVTLHPGVDAQGDFLEVWFKARVFRRKGERFPPDPDTWSFMEERELYIRD